MDKVLASAKGIIVRNGEFLFLKHIIAGKEIWGLPGGKITHGETPHQALQREVQEEISIDIKINELAGVYWFFTERENNHVFCLAYLCSPLSTGLDLLSNPAEDEVITEARWITKKEFFAADWGVNPSLTKLIKNLSF